MAQKAVVCVILAAVMWTCTVSIPLIHSSLPRLTIRAQTHFQLGFRVGQTFQDKILTTVRGNSFFMERLLPFNATLEGAKLYNKYHNTTKSIFPTYLEEIRGMAEGAQLTYSEMFLWNMQFEYQMLLEPQVNKLPPPSCSDFYLVYGENKTLLGHNEDGVPAANTTSYIIDAELTYINDEVERFTAFCYAGELCGNAFGFSDTAGIVFSVNAVFPKDINTKAVGSNFINRALMIKKLENIGSFLTEVPCSSGFSYNVGTLDGQNLINSEVSPTGVVSTIIKGYDYHFNMYLHSNVLQYSDPSSLHRLARAKELPQPNNGSDILSLLGDTSDPDYPIYRTATGPDGAATLATALFDLPRNTLYIYRGNPALAQEPMFMIQLAH